MRTHGEWRYSSTHSQPWQYVDVTDHYYTPVALPPKRLSGLKAGLNAMDKKTCVSAGDGTPISRLSNPYYYYYYYYYNNNNTSITNYVLISTASGQ
jgi:hypothetical protein